MGQSTGGRWVHFTPVVTSRDERKAFLGEFREYLIETGNRMVVDRYDEGGITPGPVEGMFLAFVRERLGE